MFGCSGVGVCWLSIGIHQTSDNNPDVTVVIVNYNTGHLLERMFAALISAKARLKLQIIAVDNASRDNSRDILKKRFPEAQLIANSLNVGFGRANNQAMPESRGRYVLLLNTDAFVGPDTLTKSIDYMEQNSRCGILGVRLIGEDGALLPSCRSFPTPWNVFLTETGIDRFFQERRQLYNVTRDYAETRNCDWVPGCYYLVRKELIDQIGLFDPRFFLYYEEIDHCRRAIEAGWEVTYLAETEVVHIGGESAKSDAKLTPGAQVSRLGIESELLYFRKHDGLRGILAAIALAALSSLVAVAKDVVRPSGGRREQRAKLKTMISLLGPTRWGTEATR
jgi:GT2 family glycosyltransferase